MCLWQAGTKTGPRLHGPRRLLYTSRCLRNIDVRGTVESSSACLRWRGRRTEIGEMPVDGWKGKTVGATHRHAHKCVCHRNTRSVRENACRARHTSVCTNTYECIWVISTTSKDRGGAGIVPRQADNDSQRQNSGLSRDRMNGQTNCQRASLAVSRDRGLAVCVNVNVNVHCLAQSCLSFRWMKIPALFIFFFFQWG